MALEERLEFEDLYVYETLRNPCLCSEFIINIDRTEYDSLFEYDWYQDEFLADFNMFVSLCCARSIGKSESLVGLALWLLINNIFPMDYVLYTVPSKVHLEPIWSKFVRYFRSNSFLKSFIETRAGINSSEFSLRLLNASQLLCRIAGQSGTGANVIGLHTPFEILDECIIGTQKIATKHGNKHASEVKIGDQILSWNGELLEYKPVLSIQKTERNQEILEIATSNNKIRVGEHHRIYTDSGYVEAKNLFVGDFIYQHQNINRSSWTDEETTFVKEQIQNSIKVKDIAKKINRTEQAIFRKLDSLNFSTKDVFDFIPLSEIEYQTILGSLLGDGSASKEIFRASYTTNHSLKQKEYVDWLYDNLKRLVRTSPKISKNGGWGTYNYTFRTLGHPKILELVEKLYINGKKTVTREYLDLLSPLGLAVWYMDDGSERGMWSTHSFSKQENEIICTYLKEKWNIDSYVYWVEKKDLYCILIHNRSLQILRNIIKPYIIPSMLYKIGEGIYNNNLPTLHVIPIAENNSTLAKIEILSIKKVNTRSKILYNFEVESNHNYFVNGILTKNSGYYPFGTWIELNPTLNTFTSGVRLIISGVPTGLREKNVCWYADQESSEYSKHRISALQNPRFTEDDLQRAKDQYGGEEDDDFIHLVLGQHGKPIFALFDRGLMEISNYPVHKLIIDGIKMTENVGSYIEKASLLSSLPIKAISCFFGIDLGYTQPTAIFIMYIDEYKRIRFHSKIQLIKVSYPLQEKFIDYLDTKFNPMFIGMDEGATGKSVRQHLLEDTIYAHKDYHKRVVAIDFSSNIVLGLNTDGEEIKSKTKPFITTVLQDYSNNHRIIYTSTDLETITELERMTFTTTATGELVYRTLTEKGGKRGDDHFTSALLCGIGAYYLTYESLLFNNQKKQLIMSSWFIG
jgi:hypothetical protein